MRSNSLICHNHVNCQARLSSCTKSLLPVTPRRLFSMGSTTKAMSRRWGSNYRDTAQRTVPNYCSLKARQCSGRHCRPIPHPPCYLFLLANERSGVPDACDCRAPLSLWRGNHASARPDPAMQGLIHGLSFCLLWSMQSCLCAASRLPYCEIVKACLEVQQTSNWTCSIFFEDVGMPCSILVSLVSLLVSLDPLRHVAAETQF